MRLAIPVEPYTVPVVQSKTIREPPVIVPPSAFVPVVQTDIRIEVHLGIGVVIIRRAAAGVTRPIARLRRDIAAREEQRARDERKKQRLYSIHFSYTSALMIAQIVTLDERGCQGSGGQKPIFQDFS